MILGYNTNGFAHHNLGDALDVLWEIGYRSVAITIDHSHFNLDRDYCCAKVASACDVIRASMGDRPWRVTIETGARFVLDPRRKHWPTLISAKEEDRERRIEFLLAVIDMGAELRAQSVSLWSGNADDNAAENVLLDRLIANLQRVLDHAEKRNVRLSFEPEPGMFIETMAQFAELHDRVDHPLFGLTLDLGHVHCLGDGVVVDHVRCWREKLWNVHVEDMRRGVHEHLMFGDGDMDFAPIFATLNEIDYVGPVHVELSRHSHDAVNVARRSFEFLSSFPGCAHG